MKIEITEFGWDTRSQEIASEMLKNNKDYKSLFSKLKEAKESIINNRENKIIKNGRRK